MGQALSNITRTEYHSIRRRLHGARIEDSLAAAWHREHDDFADRRPVRTRYSAVQMTLSGLSRELSTLLTTRHEPAPTGRLLCGPRSHMKRCHIAQRMAQRRRALVAAEAIAKMQAYVPARSAA